MWESDGGAWFQDEKRSSRASREDNVGNEALHVTGLYVVPGNA